MEDTGDECRERLEQRAGAAGLQFHGAHERHVDLPPLLLDWFARSDELEPRNYVEL
jgi:hypothetical protein